MQAKRLSSLAPATVNNICKPSGTLVKFREPLGCRLDREPAGRFRFGSSIPKQVSVSDPYLSLFNPTATRHLWFFFSDPGVRTLLPPFLPLPCWFRCAVAGLSKNRAARERPVLHYEDQKTRTHNQELLLQIENKIQHLICL